MNLKEDFIKWFLKRTKSKYQSVTENMIRNDIRASLDLIGRNIFEVSEKDYRNVIKYIEDELYKKDTPFDKFSAITGNHRPRAILGRKNYIQYIRLVFEDENEKLKLISFSDFVPKVSHDRINETYDYIKENDLELKQSTKYDVIVNGDPLPPKDFLRCMAFLQGLDIDEKTLYGGYANKPFQDLGYEIVNKGRKTDQNYWIFQGSPKIYDIEKALEDEQVKTWNVKSHIQKIKPGDKVILWVTGEKAGCYALAEVSSEIFNGFEEPGEDQYYTDFSKTKYSNEDFNSKNDRVKIKITHNLFNNPILYEEISNLPEFENLKAGSQGTNFSASKIQYNIIVSLKWLLLNRNNIGFFLQVKMLKNGMNSLSKE